jgi:hypothetical protein
VREGFEPSVPDKEYNALAKRRFRPLSHLTKICGAKAISWKHGASNETFGGGPAARGAATAVLHPHGNFGASLTGAIGAASNAHPGREVAEAKAGAFACDGEAAARPSG